MDVEERMQAAIALEEVDRHPVFPILVTSAPRLYGITQAEAWRNHDVAREALIRCYRDFGYDIGSKPNYYYPMLPGKFCGAPVRNLIPGRQLPEDALYQIDERVLFGREDYDRIASLGWNTFWEECYEEMSGKSWERLVGMQELSDRFYTEDMRICEEGGMPIFLGVAVDSVLMAFSLSRTLVEFTRDLYEVPDKVEAAMQASCDDLISNAIQVCRNNGKMTAFIVLERGSGFYYPLEIFERFEWAFLVRYVDAFLAEGILPWLHLDTDWSINLPYFKKLPKGKCVCDLDGTTDIFRAKEVLRDHMCISGDVPAALLTLGRPEEVEDYCRRLIDEVGEGGGFMLTTGCECPINVRPENLRAMVETGLNHRGRKAAGRTAPPPAAAGYVGGEVRMPEGGIAEAFGSLRYEETKRLVEAAVDGGRDPLEIIEECRLGMETVGELYSRGDYFLAELIISAEIFKEVMDRLEPLLGGGTASTLGRVVIGTPRGDIHDIGKNITATLFRAGGLEVLDLGVDVDPEDFVAEVARTGARIVAMSALITTTFDSMREVVDSLRERGLRDSTFVIIGGGPTNQEVRDYAGADAWTLDPRVGLGLCREFLSEGDPKAS